MRRSIGEQHEFEETCVTCQLGSKSTTDGQQRSVPGKHKYQRQQSFTMVEGHQNKSHYFVNNTEPLQTLGM